MTKLILFNDPHYSKIQPISRDENYSNDILNKLIEVVKIAHKLEVDYIGCTGDWFHRKSNTTFNEAINIIKLLKRSRIPIISIGGNHDFTGHNLNTLNNRALGALVASGTIKLLDDKPIVTKDVTIFGSSFNPYYDIKRQAYIKPKEYEDHFTLLLSHGTLILTEHGTFFGNYTNMSKLKSLEGELHNVIFNGHYHNDQGVCEVNDDCTVFNIGSLARNILTEDSRDRIPKVLYLNIKNRKIAYKQIELKSVRSSDEVFVSRNKEDNDVNEIKDFVNILMEESGELTLNEDKDIIHKIVKQMKYSSEIETKVSEYLER